MKKLLFLIAGLVIAGTAYSADEWDKTTPCKTGVGSCASSDLRSDFPSDQQKNNTALDRVLSNYREGMTLTYSSASTIVVTAGEIVCSNSDGSVRKMRKNPANTNVTFSDIDTGSEASSTTYYIYAVADADAETATFKISASATAPTGVTYYKRLGSFYNDSSSNITLAGISNDNKDIKVTSTTIELDTKTLTNGFLGRTTTGSSASFHSGTTIAVPTGCYVTGGYKQPDGNFIRWDYACP